MLAALFGVVASCLESAVLRLPGVEDHVVACAELAREKLVEVDALSPVLPTRRGRVPAVLPVKVRFEEGRPSGQPTLESLGEISVALVG